jgi:hypothetical protein
MDNAMLEKTDPSRLAGMLTPNGSDRWRPDDRGPILRHQRSVRLEADLAVGDDRNDTPHLAPDGARRMWRMTFGELLDDAHPPAEMLLRVKRFAKACKLNGDGPLPPDVATVLYFASIVVARLRCGQRITDLDDDALRKGIEWARAQAWMDPATRSIFDEAAAKWAATG